MFMEFSDSDFGSEDSYNSEDDEFLAYHDEHIQAQVRRYLAEAQKKRDEAELRNQAMLERTDKEEVGRVKQVQIELLGGSEKKYKRVTENLKALRFEPYLAEEQFKLYQWREEFFHSKFPDGQWFTDGADDSHSFDTVPYQITMLWEEVVCLACCPDKEPGSKVYFSNDEILSHKAKMRFDRSNVEMLEYSFHKDSLEEEDLSLSDVTHMLVAVFPSSPSPLELLALKSCLVEGLSLEEVPKSIQAKAVHGFWQGREPPANLSEEGRGKFSEVKEMLEEEEEDEDGYDAEEQEDEEDEEEGLF